MNTILSAIQFYPKLATNIADVKNNYMKCEALINQAARFGSQFIVFPELCFTGYSFFSKDEAARVCEKSDGPTFRLMRGVAIELKAYVSWGYVEVDSNNLYNAATLVGPDGAVLTQYRKCNLFGSDFIWATSGISSAPVVDTEFGRTSIIVCRDLRDKIPLNIPRVSSKSVPMWKNEKIDLVAASTNWGKGAFPPNTWMDFAADNQATLIIADRWGKETYMGEHGELLTDFGHGKSCIITKEWKIYKDGLKFDSDCCVSASLEI
jgi:predicted amidohydrolase